jgi:3-oxoacyl-[acyl-carrier protein] reductase
MDLRIAGKVAVVTGASKGLGFGSALALSEEGAKVVLCARNQEQLDDAADKLPGETLTVAADITDPAAPAQVVAAAVERFGACDIVVGNAGGPPPARALDLTDEPIGAAVNANLTASVRLAREALPHMRSAGWGRVVFITSSSIKEPIPILALSNLARTGLWAWAKTAAADIAAEEPGITINLVSPGIHDTDRIRALGYGAETRMGDPLDFGKVVAFLCSQAAGFVNGTAVVVDGGELKGLL